MGCFAPAAILHPPLICASRRKRGGAGFRAKHKDDDDPLLQAAINGASIRFQETHRPEPLFLDLYAGCFVSSGVERHKKQFPLSRTSTCHYCLATKFIDDKLLSLVNNIDGVMQIVLLTDGMDTRPYRLKWPNSTIIFDVSPERVFQIAAQKLEGVGAKIPRSCLFYRVPSESDIQQVLCRKGFSGNRPSIWALQGLPLMSLASFEEILLIVSSLAMKGCIFLGELPVWLAETDVGIKPDMKLINKLFMSNGFRLDVVTHDEVARHVGRDPPSADYKSILFVAEQLRLSDDQMESWRREFQRVEEDGDEEGFEELV